MVHDLAEWRKVRAKCLWREVQMESKLAHSLWKSLGIRGTQYQRKQGETEDGNWFESLYEEQLDSQSPLLPG